MKKSSRLSMASPWLHCIWLGLLASALRSSQSLAEIPVAKNAKAFTTHDYCLDELDFYRKALIDTYKNRGQKNPDWDTDALDFLEKFCKYITYSTKQPIYFPGGLPTAKELEKLGTALVGKKCNDPQVLYGYAIVLDDLGRIAQSLVHYHQAFEGMSDGRHPPELVLSLAGRLLAFVDDSFPKIRQPFIETIRTQSITACKGTRQPKTHRRVLLALIEHSAHGNALLLGQIYTRLKGMDDADPWLREMIGGCHHIAAAWKARGGGWAAEVTPDGWKGFADHLKEARECLTRAWKLEPTFPEAADNMITVVMGDGGQGDTVRAWLDRALEAQFDYAPAYQSAMHAYLPRWGGSAQEILDLGLEAAETSRFDTLVPSLLIDAIYKTRRDLAEKTWQVLKDPDMAKAVETMFQGYAKAKHKEVRDYFASMQAALAWRAGNVPQARMLLELLGNSWHPEQFRRADLQPEFTVSKIFAYTGVAADRVRNAQKLGDEGKLREARAAFEALADEAAADDKGALFYKASASRYDQDIRFAAGEWIDLWPKDKIMNCMIVHGRWNIDSKGRLVGTQDHHGLAIYWNAEFGRRYEVEATIDCVSPYKVHGAAGIALDHDGSSFNNGLGISNSEKGIYFYIGGWGEFKKQQLAQPSDLHIRYWDDHWVAWSNGKPLALRGPGEKLMQLEGKPHLGIAAFYDTPGTTVLVSKLRVHKLENDPVLKPSEK